MQKSKQKVIILGIDPGVATTGFGVISCQGSQIESIDYGVILTKPKIDLSIRLKQIHQELKKLIKKYKPDYISVEQIFFYNNVKTAINVSQARGAVLLTAELEKVPLVEFTPLQIKQAICGYGGADKKQVQKMVQTIFKLKKLPKPDDAADALAIAFCASSVVKKTNYVK